MNKTAIKNFAIWARNKLIADIKYKAGLLGITDKAIKSPLSQSTNDVQFFDIGTKEPYSISGIEMDQRDKLAAAINNKAQQIDYQTAYQAVIEEVAYTWFNRLIAIRFMEVNDYLPSRIRVLSSESVGKNEPDLVTNPFDTDLDFTSYEKDRIVQLKNDNQLDELFRILFIKQCNALNVILPNLFEKTCDYTELLLNVAFTDKDGVVYHLVNDIKENDFKIRTETDEEAIKCGELAEEDAPSGQVEIIGWLYQYYNTELKDETFALLKKNVKITKERIPAATQLFTPDWIVRYMVENSLGRLWLEGHPNDSLKSEWKYYLDEAEQEVDVQKQLDAIREEYKTIKPEDIKVIDPCMGSGHILVYAFDVLMQIYESYGYSQRDAAKSIVENNIYGLDIDNRAYQLAYFAVMMKARQYNRRILNGEIDCHVYSIQESNGINKEQLQYFGMGMDEMERNIAMLQIQGLLDTFNDAKEYGSILNLEEYDWELLNQFVGNISLSGQLSFDAIGIEDTQNQLRQLVEFGAVMVQKYDAVMTNPPYMGGRGITPQLSNFLKKNFNSSKSDLFAVFIAKAYAWIKENGYISMVTPQSWMFLSTFEELRHDIVSKSSLINMCHLGAKAFECGFGTTAFCIRGNQCDEYIATYIKLVDYLDELLKEGQFSNKYNRFFKSIKSYNYLPNTIFAYWCSSKLEKVFIDCNPLEEIVSMDCGIKTGDNEQFIRLWHEVSFKKICLNDATYETTLNGEYKWFKYNKGGGFRKWYGGYEYVINLEYGARDIKKKISKETYRLRNKSNYFSAGLLWPLIGDKSFSARLLPQNVLTDVASNVIYMEQVDYYLLGYLNSSIYNEMLNMVNPTVNYPIDSIGQVPYVDIEEKDSIEKIAKENTEFALLDWNDFETSWDFVNHPFINLASKSETNIMSVISTNLKRIQIERITKVTKNEKMINSIFSASLKMEYPEIDSTLENNIMLHEVDLGRDIRSFVSYAVGCMFGRYSLDIDGLTYAGGAWDDSKYSTFIPNKDNILLITDEEYSDDDIVGLFVTFVKTVYGTETLEKNLDFIAKALGNKGDTSREIIRNYFVKDFFKNHCKIYQKRPIYWLFDSGKADGFKALIYMHRYDENTIGNLRIDYLHKMQRVYDSEIVRMQDTINNSTNAREVATAEKRKEKLIKQLKETKDYDEKIAHLALARTVIDLDDGVKVNYEKVQTGTDGKKLEVLAKI